MKQKSLPRNDIIAVIVERPHFGSHHRLDSEPFRSKDDGDFDTETPTSNRLLCSLSCGMQIYDLFEYRSTANEAKKTGNNSDRKEVEARWREEFLDRFMNSNIFGGINITSKSHDCSHT